MTDKFASKSLVGGKLGQFEIRSEIARGGMGVVYKGYQPSLDRWVAIKALPADLATDRDLVARFQREAEAMVRLNHANIVQIIDRGQEAGQYYFAMEFVEGSSVKDLLKSETIATDTLFDIVLQTCDGLEYAHKKGLVHRDVKPANLLWEEKTGVVKIADFGIAHFSKKDEDMLTLTAQNVGMGTMNYMAPEQKVDAGSVDHRADIYALGVIVYEAFTGKLPLGKFKLPSEVNPKLPRRLDTVVQKCMESDAKDRYPSCAELKVDLLAAKAETHEKTLSRKVREAIDFTVTAFKTKKTAAASMLGCLGLVVAGAVFGTMFLLRGGDQKKYEATRVTVTAAEKRLAALLVGGAAGDEEQTAAAKLLAEAEAEQAPGAKLQKLASALERFQHGIEVAARWRSDKAAEVRVAAKAVRDAARDLPEDALKALATRKLDEAEKAASASESFDPKATTDSVADARFAVDVAKTMSEQEKGLRTKLESAAADDPNRKKAEEALDKAAAARSAGDPKAALAALKDADAASALATNSARQVKDPVVPPVSVPDPALVRAYEDARAKAQELGDEVGRIIGEAKKLELSEGRAELKEGADLETEAGELAAKDPGLAKKKLDEAQEKLAAGGDKALAALRARVDRDKAAAEVAQAFAPDEYGAAGSIDAETRGLKGAALAERLVTASKAFSGAADKARGPAEVRWKRLLAVAARARALAEARLEGGAKGPLAPCDAALEHAKKAHDGNLAAALREIDAAIDALDSLDIACPRAASLASASVGTRLGSDLGFKDRLDGVAGCSRGFVLAARNELRCFTPAFGPAATDAVAPAFVLALASGDGDDFYAGLANNKIVHYAVGNGIEAGDPLPGDLSALPNPPWAIAYDRQRKFLYVASQFEVSVYSTETGKSPRTPIDLRDTGIKHALSIAVLADGSVVVTGHGSPTDEPEARWKFAARQWRWDETAGWQAKGGRDDGLASVAAVGDTLVGLYHGDKGRLAVWPKGVALADAPTEILTGSREGVCPADGLKLSVFGHHAYVLDLSLVMGKYAYRKRVRVFDLKD